MSIELDQILDLHRSCQPPCNIQILCDEIERLRAIAEAANSVMTWCPDRCAIKVCTRHEAARRSLRYALDKYAEVSP
jgi:hypothetical protein